MARKKQTPKTMKKTVRKGARGAVVVLPPVARDWVDPCANVTTEDICNFLTDLRATVAGMAKCLRDSGICVGGAGVPADPPPWPPK